MLQAASHMHIASILSTSTTRLTFYSASALFEMQTAVIATANPVCLSVCPSVRHVPVFCPDDWRYDRAVFSIIYDIHSSFWTGKAYPDIRRGSPQRGRSSESTPPPRR